ncbi:MAG TPA: 2-phospho-L-lactate transferase CofD family protein, partial [Gaiellaceae bacterium]|nr:2-phospho-L-lactate transferase CofD family protein [Gaiellaceae bacterium]
MNGGRARERASRPTGSGGIGSAQGAQRPSTGRAPGSILVFAGGVGGARFIRGLTRVVDPRRVTVIGNTGDDDTFFGLHVAPDLDTVLYTLAGRVDRSRGFGLAGDTFRVLDRVGALGGPTWFGLGDRDLATHLVRTRWLQAGVPLSEVTRRLARLLGVRATLLPMSDDPVRTFVHTERGRLAFQRYL